MSHATAVGTELDESRWLGDVDRVIGSSIDARGFPARLAEAMRYAALGPGKRVRPMLCGLCALAVGERLPDESVRIPAAAVEMVHAFSLVHDDLPAMDDDDLRRGRPTTHKAFDEATAILAGDALQGLAFEVLAEAGSQAAVGVDLAQRWLLELTRATNDMIAGQVWDTLGGGDEAVTHGMADADRLVRVHRCKTGALLRAACRMGAWSAVEPAALRALDASEPEALSRITAYAEALGLMFQAVDDLLDVTSDAATLGKATQKDGDAGKLTYPKVFGVEGTRAQIAELHELARSALAGFGASADPLREMAERLATRVR